MSNRPSVTFRRTQPGPIERAWVHLTAPELLPALFGPESSIEPRAGGRVSLMGWHSMLDIVEAALRGEKIEERSIYMKKNAALTGVDLANLAR